MQQLTLADPRAARDLVTYLTRADRAAVGDIRVIAESTSLLVYVPVLFPRGLTDTSPTVLGLRIFRLAVPARCDCIVAAAELVTAARRAAEADDAGIDLPQQRNPSGISWAGVAPPPSGWLRERALDGELLTRAAQDGISQIATGITAPTGQTLVQRARSAVWATPIPEAPELPAGAAFAGFTLGFVTGEDEPALFRQGPWRRVSTSRGHVLVYAPGY